MNTDPFDTGPTGKFRTLCQKYPDDTVYRGADGFRSLWGPIFYRGRANGTARLLVIGQDPAQTEAFTRRILSGQAGQRVQGFVEKLGFTRSYLMINAFAYGIFNQDMAMPHLNDPEIQAYRHQWLEAAFAKGRIEAVVTFGNAAFNAWTAFKATPAGQAVTAFHQSAGQLECRFEQAPSSYPESGREQGAGALRQRLHRGRAAADSQPRLSHGPAALDARLGFLGEAGRSAGHAARQHLHRRPLGAQPTTEGSATSITSGA